MQELYCEVFSLYSKVHFLHIRTVAMKDTKTLHPLLGEHYELIESMQDTFGEDIIQKSMGKQIPSPMECLKSATISSEMMYEDAEEITDDLYKDYEYLKSALKKATSSEKDLLIQNILLGIWDSVTKLCADMSREMEGVEKKEKEPVEKESKIVKMGIQYPK